MQIDMIEICYRGHECATRKDSKSVMKQLQSDGGGLSQGLQMQQAMSRDLHAQL
jgi:hypothetical protein